MASRKTPERRTRTRALDVNRAESIGSRFSVGKKVIVSDFVPPTREWPGVKAEMNQFFCGEELTILSVMVHPDDPDRIALELDTKAHGCKSNHWFNLDWVSSADEPIPVAVLAHPVKRARRGARADATAVQEIRDFLKAADEKLQIFETSKKKDYARPEVLNSREIPSTYISPSPVEFGEDKAKYPATEDAEPTPELQPAKGKHEIGWGTAIGGALAGVLASAWAQQQRAKKASTKNEPLLFIPPEPAEEEASKQAVPETQVQEKPCYEPAVAR